MAWVVKTVEEFDRWILDQPEKARVEILASIRVLEEYGPQLSRPRVDTLKGSRHVNMKELRVQVGGDPWRVLFAFDPKREAIVLLGGNKAGDKRWYRTNIPVADDLFDRHLKSLESETE